MNLIIGHYYVIDVDPKLKAEPYNNVKCTPNHCLKNLVVQYISKRGGCREFEHTMENGHHCFYSLWTRFYARTISLSNFTCLKSHIYDTDFVVKKHLNPILLKCIAKFKEIVARKKLKIICILYQLGLNKDPINVILDKLYTK